MLRGSLHVEAMGDKARVFFMQRGNTPENENVPVKLYRRLSDEINFSSGLAGDEYGKWFEYIDNLKYTDAGAELIFEGMLPIKHSFCEYIDADVKVAHTYTYWTVADAFGENVVLGPTACKVRDTEVWWSYQRALDEMKAVCAENMFCEMRDYGETTKHRKLAGLLAGNKEKMLALAGAVHASEPGPELLIKALRYVIGMHPELLSKVGIAILPAVNADVREESVLGAPQYLRKNPNGVDLNRNFDCDWHEEYVYGFSNADPNATTYHGPYPVSENETRAAVNFVDSIKPVGLFVYDSCSVITEDTLLFDGLPEDGRCYNYAIWISNVYSRAFRENHPGCGTFTAEPIEFPPQLDVFNDTGMPGGTFEMWTYKKYGIPSFSLQSSLSEEGKSNNNDDVSREILEQWSLRHAYALIAVLEEFAK